MQIRDRSGESFNGNVIRHGPGPVATSDRGVAASTGSISPEGPCQGNAHVPGHSSGTEVALIESNIEPCTAEVADAGGHVTNGAPSVDKCASVKSHGQLMRAHQTGSYTKDDHEALNGDSSSGPMPMSKPVEKSESASTPVVANLGRQPFSNNTIRSAPRVESSEPKARQAVGIEVTNPGAHYVAQGSRFGSI